MGIFVVRAFVRMREFAMSHADLARRLEELEQRAQALAVSHDSLSRHTTSQLKQVFDALRALVAPPDPPRRPIGFVSSQDKPAPADGSS